VIGVRDDLFELLELLGPLDVYDCIPGGKDGCEGPRVGYGPVILRSVIPGDTGLEAEVFVGTGAEATAVGEGLGATEVGEAETITEGGGSSTISLFA
jgi:hypothetical protein